MTRTKESRNCLAKVRMASLDRSEQVQDLERDAGELCAIFATISMKVQRRLDTETPPKRRKST